MGLYIFFFTRYSSIRKQFGPKPGVEVPVLEYQLQVKTHVYKVLLFILIYVIRFPFCL